MAPIAEWLVLRMLARAPGDSFRFGDSHHFRLEAGAGVRAVAKGLAFGATAGAPPILAGFDFLDDRSALADKRFSHKGLDCWINGSMEVNERLIVFLFVCVNMGGDFEPQGVQPNKTRRIALVVSFRWVGFHGGDVGIVEADG